MGRRHPVEIVGMGEDRPRQPDHLCRGVPAEPGEGIVDPEEAAFEVKVGDAFDGELQALLETAPFVVRSSPLGDVPADTEDAGRLAVVIEVDTLGGLKDAGGFGGRHGFLAGDCLT
jgi:hypothetical protein